MLKLFSNAEKPANSHNRSQTLLDLQASSNKCNHSSASTTLEDGLQSIHSTSDSSIRPRLTQRDSSIGSVVTEPIRAHQRPLTEQIRASKDLPPLMTETFKNLSMFTGDKPVQVKVEEKGGKLSDWFKGESEPISIGILPSPTKEKADPLDTLAPSSEIRPTSLIQKKSTAQAIPKPVMASRFSFFSSKASLAKSTPQAADLNDELIELDISRGLFPAGPADPFSPAAFKNLQQNAEGLLLRLQTAYKERTMALREVTTEKETLAEEAEGTETRAKHLKMQLDDMSVKLAEQDEAIMNLVDELAQEKLARREEEEARKRSVKLVERMECDHPPTTNDKRMSRSNTISDSGFESEDDSSADSVFSRRYGTHSPAMSMSSVSTTNSPDGGYQLPEFSTALSSPQAARLRVPPGHCATKSLSASYHHNIPEEPVQSRCVNCDGVRASEAWSVVDVLREENAGLKQRVGELEGALDGCLDVVGSLS